MLTGHVPFRGGTVSDTIAAVLGGEPEWDALPDATPAGVRLLLRRCLEKDPKRRLQDLGDVRFEVAELDSRASAVAAVLPERDSRPAALGSGSKPASRQRRPTYPAVALIVLPLLLLAGGAGLFYLAKPAVPVTSPSECTQLTNFTDSATSPSLSPDGRMVTFKRGEDPFLSSGSIYVKLLPNGESVQLTPPARVYGPVFTPDGSRIAYTQNTAGSWDSWTVPVLGGQPTRLLPNASGLSWIADHRVLFSEIKTGLHMGIVTATEGRADSREIYIHPDEHAMAHYSYASPDRQSVLVVEMTGAHAFDVPAGTVRWTLFWPAGRTSGHLSVSCLVSGWTVDVLQRGGWRQLAPLAPEVP
jgi:eukaryotic-like serine/threonine-protein kinase